MKIVKSASEEEIAQLVSLADILTKEIGNVSLMANNAYNWHILEMIHDADKIAYQILDKLSAADPNLKLAVRKMRPRIL